MVSSCLLLLSLVYSILFILKRKKREKKKEEEEREREREREERRRRKKGRRERRVEEGRKERTEGGKAHCTARLPSSLIIYTSTEHAPCHTSLPAFIPHTSLACLSPTLLLSFPCAFSPHATCLPALYYCTPPASHCPSYHTSCLPATPFSLPSPSVSRTLPLPPPFLYLPFSTFYPPVLP